MPHTAVMTMKKLEVPGFEKLSVLNLGGMWLVTLPFLIATLFEIAQYGQSQGSEGPVIVFSLFSSSSKPTYVGIPVDSTAY